MKWYTHSLGSLILILAIAKHEPLTLGFVLGTLTGSILPDIIEQTLGLPHRSKIIHNFFTPLALLAYPNQLALGIMLGYIHHLILDATTKKGVYILNKHIKGPLTTNKTEHNIAILITHIPLILL